jgi:hypothetical protein
MENDSYADEKPLSQTSSVASSLVLPKLPSLSQSSQLSSSPLRTLPLPNNHQPRVDPLVEHTLPVMPILPVPSKLKKDDYPQKVVAAKKTLPLMKQALKDANEQISHASDSIAYLEQQSGEIYRVGKVQIKNLHAETSKIHRALSAKTTKVAKQEPLRALHCLRCISYIQLLSSSRMFITVHVFHLF